MFLVEIFHNSYKGKNFIKNFLIKTMLSTKYKFDFKKLRP